ncbi:MAG: ankyrin repeat domain-containing protein [Alphaproteobacteria bacterium]
MSVVDIGDDEDKEDEYFKSCNTQELNGMFLNSAREGDWGRMERLLAAGAELDYGGGAALTAAAGQGHLAIARNLIRLGLKSPLCKQEALSDAVYAGKLEVVRFLIEEVQADPAGNDSTVLFTAVVNNKPEMARLLLEKGASAHANKDTLLCIALSHRFEGVAAALLDFGADPRKHYRDMNAYEWAAEENLAEFSKRLRDWSNTDVYMSPGFFKRQTLEELRGIYDEKQTRTGFHLAAQAGCFDVIRDKILESGGRIRAEDLLNKAPGGQTVLGALGESGQLSIAFDARLWAGRKEEALALLRSGVSPTFRSQVEEPRLALDIDLLALKSRAKTPALKLKPPKL